MATVPNSFPNSLDVSNPSSMNYAHSVSDKLAYFAAMLGYVLLLPPQLNLVVMGSTVPPYRIFLIVAAVFIALSMIKGAFRFRWPDIAMIAAIGWICLAMSMTSETDEAITGSAAHAIDIGFAYFFARLTISSPRALRVFLLLILPGLLALGILLAVEAVTHTHILQPIFANITGAPFHYGSTPRLGLLRAQGPFAHPILAGIFLASFLPLYWLAGLRDRAKFSGVFAAICSIVTVSSATFLALAAGGFLLAYNWATERVENISWRFLFMLAAFGLFAAEIGTKSGSFSLLVRFASLNAMSAYNRVMIWEHGSQNVIDNPWFGIGYSDWARPVWMGDSLDNFWLLTAVRFGVVPVLLFTFMVGSALIVLVLRSLRSSPLDARLERGVAIALAVFALGLISVSIWLSPLVWFFMLLGIAVSLGGTSANALMGSAPYELPEAKPA
ncbi:O-antigen ligase family protein [Erythrobacter insulae]|uniref:O-antigen ligase family protein n=1 Tax=Erythrobacter insulae TaxID=2584124 RepID=A0A547PBZ7_9SPHN|nr:O-antigen ligase family protein [Erythrobacter insulae]TRD11662.1 O-antigen ligase family protein [Erythrobacter insulae]